jgi:hypothetical protein
MTIIRRAKNLIDWSEAMPKEVAQVVLDKIKENAKKHIGSFGKKYKANAAGNPDWRESGHMLDDAMAYKGGKIQFFAWYSKLVNEKRPFADGFSEADKKDILKRIKPIIGKALKKGR